MQAAGWSDNIRTKDRQHHRGRHYINCPFKPEGQPLSRRGNRRASKSDNLSQLNILAGMAENESVVKNVNDGEQRAIALAWLFHLMGDVHQPLHTTQLFSVEYPDGDRGGNEICVRVTQGKATNGLTQVLGRGDYFKLEFDTATKLINGTAKSAGISEVPTHRTYEH
jgi:S1/P1 Nuclease